jgi:hypothetical protein
MLGSAATFGVFLAVGSVVRSEGKPELVPVASTAAAKRREASMKDLL